MITSSTWGRRSLFRNQRWARLLIDTLYHYHGSAYLLHEFVIMPDHVHVLITPRTSLEKAVQFIKGGFSYRVRKQLGSNMEIWQKGFSDHRIRDAEDYRLHQIYIRQNPIRKGLCERAEQYPYSSACSRYELDPAPQGLKPAAPGEQHTARLEGAPFQGKPSVGAAEGAPFQSGGVGNRVDTEPFHSNNSRAADAVLPANKISPQRQNTTTIAAKSKTA